MTRPFLAAFLLAFLSTTLLAQAGKDMGPAGQYYGQTKPIGKRFKFAPGPKEGGCKEVEYGYGAGGSSEYVRDEYAILQKDAYVKCQDITIRADKMTYNFRTHDSVAEGHVIIDQGPMRLTGSRSVFNVDTKTGTLFEATGAMAPDMYFIGEKIEKTGDDTYRLTNGMLTSCDLDNPSWSFHVAIADVTLDDYAHMRDVSFRAHDMPLIFTPRLVWPTKRDRSQGFLMPRIVFQSKFGSRLEMGYFVPIGDAFDATGYLDLSSTGYNGVGVNVRYRPSQDVKQGNLDAYAVHDRETGKEQWRYAYKHAQDNLPGGFRAVVDMEDFSNLDFFRQYSHDSRLHTLSQIYSSAYLTKNRPTYSLNILTDRRDIVNAASADPTKAPPRQRFEQLPSVQFRTYPNRLGETPLYFSLESSISHLLTTGLVNGPTANYYRGDVFPTLSLQLRTPAWLSIRPQVSVRETYYTASLDQHSAENPTGTLNAVDESIRRSYGQAQVEVVGPSFSRVFNQPFAGFTKFKHVIEPRFRYLYTTAVSDQDRVIRFDTVDTPFLPIVRHSVEYSLTQRLIGREAGPNSSPREVMSFTLRQTVSLGNEFTTANSGGTSGSSVPPGAENRFTPLTANLHVNPYQSITFDATATYGNVSHQIDQTSVSANLVGTGKNIDKYLAFTYFATYRQPGQTSVSTSSQIRLNSGSSLLGDRIRGDVQLSYDAKQGKFLEQRYLIGGNASCYGVALEFRRFLVFVPEGSSVKEKQDFSYGISVSLKNIGAIGLH